MRSLYGDAITYLRNDPTQGLGKKAEHVDIRIPALHDCEPSTDRRQTRRTVHRAVRIRSTIIAVWWWRFVQLSSPAVRSVKAASRASSKVTSAAVALAVTSSSVSAPTITEATAGRDSSQARDTW